LFQILFDVPNDAITIRSRPGVVAPILPWDFVASEHALTERGPSFIETAPPLEIV
jgi:hypothetical protein